MTDSGLVAGSTAPDTPPVALGAHADGGGVAFAVHAPDAERVDVCVLDDGVPAVTLRSIALSSVTGGVHHGYVPGLRPGARYGFRAYGPWDPRHGLRFNPAKLLLDPYARAVSGTYDPSGPVYGHAGTDDLIRDDADSAPYVPHGVVVDPAATEAYDWEGDALPRHPWPTTVIYEAHVRGLTMRHPAVPEPLRGTYAGLAHPAVIEHLQTLGITAIELLPVHQHVSEPAVTARGLSNYWGYSTIGFFAPHAAYAASGSAGEQVREFKDMVRALHAAGIEVLLDVVYNHTAEGDELGPTLSFRGLDNPGYYRLRRGGRHYANLTGTGNTFAVDKPAALGLVLDSLRYWATEMHVDGFRFDLATALTRSHHGWALHGPFLDAVAADPVLADRKLIAEPWDVGHHGYRLGEFPDGWSEWNDRYRDGVRDFWRGSATGVRDLATRLAGSSDVFRGSGRPPTASINYVAAHDGMTLRDVVSYERKHNLANGEDDRDGTPDDRSCNYGVEGPTGDLDVTEVRARQVRNLATTLLISAGVPMWLAGDELGRTQRGNNNAYCQDNEISWLEWDSPTVTASLVFVRKVIALRAAHPALRQSSWFDGAPVIDGGPKDVVWLAPGGTEMTYADWHDSSRRTLGMLVAGSALRDTDATGQRLADDSFLAWLHADAEPLVVTLPATPGGEPGWTVVLDTTTPDGSPRPHAPSRLPPGGTYELPSRSTVIWRASP